MEVPADIIKPHPLVLERIKELLIQYNRPVEEQTDEYIWQLYEQMYASKGGPLCVDDVRFVLRNVSPNAVLHEMLVEQLCTSGIAVTEQTLAGLHALYAGLPDWQRMERISSDTAFIRSMQNSCQWSIRSLLRSMIAW